MDNATFLTAVLVIAFIIYCDRMHRRELREREESTRRCFARLDQLRAEREQERKRGIDWTTDDLLDEINDEVRAVTGAASAIAKAKASLVPARLRKPFVSPKPPLVPSADDWMGN